MIKNSPDTAKPDTPARAVILDKETARYIFRALLLTLVFAWALVNLQDVLQFLGRVLGVLSPFLMGGAFAFVINILLRPLERTWRRICKKAPEKLTRPICLTLSTLLVLGILFARAAVSAEWSAQEAFVGAVASGKLAAVLGAVYPGK